MVVLRFAKGHKWGTFGSIGTAWAITKRRIYERYQMVEEFEI